MYPREDDFLERIRSMERRIRELERATSVPSVSLTGGGRRGVTAVAYANALEGQMVPPSITTDFNVFATASIDVPDWATHARVVAFAQATGVLNQSDSESAIFVRVDIGNVESVWAGQSMQFSTSVFITEGTAAVNLAAELTGASLGSTIECDLLCHQASSGTPMLLNMGSVSAIAIFTDE